MGGKLDLMKMEAELLPEGWHFHFLSDDKKFHDLNLTKDMSADIRSAEQDTQSDMLGDKGK